MFTCAGRRVALMGAFRKAMAELDLEGKLVAADITAASPAFHAADAGELVPHVGRTDYIPRLKDIVNKHDINLLVPLTDLDLKSLSKHQREFTDVGCTVMVGSEEIISLCRDKAQTNQLFHKAELGSITTCTLSEFREHPFYPCFVKPTRGSAGIGTGVIHSEKELNAHVATFGEMLIVQEYVTGQEYTIDVYRSRDGQTRCIVPRQRLVVRAGEVEKGVTVKDKILIEAAMKISGMLDGLWGVFCCQCRRNGNNYPRFFEINPRFGGGATLAIAAGANLPLYLLQEVLGLPITAKLGEFTDKMLMLRYDEAIYLPVSELRSLPGYDSPQFR